MFLFLFFILGRSGLCINDHRTQNQSLKQAPLVFYEKFPVAKSCHFGSHYRKRSHQTNRCIARTNRYRALHENAFLMQLTPGYYVICLWSLGYNAIQNVSLFRGGSMMISERVRFDQITIHSPCIRKDRPEQTIKT